MNVCEIMKKWLADNGYDGLCNNHDCGCTIEELMLCDSEGIEHCQPGYKSKDESGDFIITTNNPERRP